jgi:hypothetical protein
MRSQFMSKLTLPFIPLNLKLSGCTLSPKHFIGAFLVLMFFVGCGSGSRNTRPSPPVRYKPSIAPVGDKLIVVSTGSGLNTYGKSIQQTFHSVLKRYLNDTLPFTLLTVEPGDVKNPFSNWYDVNGSRTLWKKIQKIRFGYSLDALENLKRVQDESSQLSRRILYLTDDGNIPDDWDEIDPNVLKVPKDWRQDGIKLTVLTSGSCRVWNEKADAAQCKELRGRDDLENVLDNFIGE